MHKAGTRHIADGAAKKANGEAEDEHVGEIECGLEKAVHPVQNELFRIVILNKLCFEEIVVESVFVHVKGDGSTGGKACPSPKELA